MTIPTIFVPPIPDEIDKIISKLRGQGSREHITRFINNQEWAARNLFFEHRTRVRKVGDERWLWFHTDELKSKRLIMQPEAVEDVCRMLIEGHYIPFGGTTKTLFIIPDKALIELTLRLADDARIRWEDGI